MRLETENDLSFDYFLAEKLRMPVAEMRRRVSMQEWMEWNVYYGKQAQVRQLAGR